MGTAEYTFSPDAASFYERLDVPADADQSTIRKAGKLAYKQYSEADRDEFLRLRRAREALTDEDTRQAYDRFCAALGADRGTEAYNKWQSRGAQQSVATFIREFEPDSEADPDRPPLWERVRVGDPVVTRSYGKPKGAVHVNFWDGEEQRLYINNVHPRGDIYLDPAGQFYTAAHERLEDIEYTVVDAENAIIIEYEHVTLRIDLAGGGRQNALREEITTDEPVIKETNFSPDDDLSVNLWEDRRLFINGFHPTKDLYISLDNGRLYKHRSESEPVSDIVYNLSSDGQELTLTDGQHREIVIDLVGKQRDDLDPDPLIERALDLIGDPDSANQIYFPGVLARVALGWAGQIVALIIVILGLSVLSPSNVVSYPVIFVSGVILSIGGIVVIGGSGVLALVDGRFGRAGFAGAVVIAAVWYYFGVERLIAE